MLRKRHRQQREQVKSVAGVSLSKVGLKDSEAMSRTRAVSAVGNYVRLINRETAQIGTLHRRKVKTHLLDVGKMT